jgi:predicted MFS family arabinose efflux permease
LFLTPLGDVVERRRLIVLLLILSAIALASAALSPNLLWLSLSSLVMGITNVSAQVIIPFVAQLTPVEIRGRVIGSLLSGALLGVLLARTISGLVGGSLGWRAMYWIAALLMLVLAFWLRNWLPVDPPRPPLQYSQLMRSLSQLFQKEPELRAAGLNAALSFGVYSAFWATLVFFVKEPPYYYGSQVAGLFGLIGIASAIYSPLMGRLTDRYNPRAIVGIGAIHLLLAFVIFAMAGTHLAGLIIGIVVMDIGKVASFVGNQTRIFRLTPDAPSRVNTVFMVSTFVGGAVGSLLGTYCWETWHWQGVCFLCIGMMAIALIAHFTFRTE